MTPQWTALFYTYAEDDATKDYAKDLENLLLSVEHSEAFNLLLFRSEYSSTSDNIDGVLYQLKSDPDSGSRSMVPIKAFPSVNPGESALLRDVLTTVREENLIQGKFLFFLWDHGTGFGVFNWNPFEKKGLTTSTPGLTVVRSSPRRRLGGGMKINEGIASFNEININMLTMAEINEGLKALGPSTPIVVIMLNCWTQMLETGFEFTDTVEWLVAPETVHYFKGYDYKGILQAIAQTPDISTAGVAQKAIDSLYAFFNADDKWRWGLEDLVVSAVQPSRSNAVVNALIDISKRYLEHSDADTFKGIATVRRNCTDLSIDENNVGWEFIDLLNFVSCLKADNLIGAEFHDRLHMALNDYIGYTHPVPDKLTDISTFGCSIYHPNDLIDFDPRLYFSFFFEKEMSKLSRAGDHSWTNYLRKYKEDH